MAVREYVSPTGKVFAVAWHGPSRPDLKQLLGSHFKEFRQVLQARGPGHGPVLVQLPGLVVQLGGHMRDFVGRAYLPPKSAGPFWAYKGGNQPPRDFNIPDFL